MRKRWSVWRQKHRKLYIAMLVMLAALLLFLICNPCMQIVDYFVESDAIDNELTIVVIADLHSCRYGKNQRTLVCAVEETQPDLVLLAGDIFDDNLSHERARMLVEAMAERYPTYYVSGNHDYWSEEIEEIKQMVRDAGAEVLDGQCANITIGEQSISICGIDDPTYIGEDAVKTQLEEAATAREAEFSILVAHRPEMIEDYLDYDFDLVVSGHAHGGQWRIPGILNGLYAPDQGLLPEYAAGRYEYEGTVHIVSRGLSRENLPIPRIFNRPELSVIHLK